MTEQHNHQRKPERIALAMQGGGAVGAFQAGVLEALHEANVEVDACCGASGSLPPWFAPIEIGGAWYWDGSLSSAAPLHHIVETAPADVQTTILRADLWSPDGQVPDNLSDAEIRLKNIEHGSRAAAYQEALNESQRLRSLLAYALNCIEPARRQSDPQLMNAAALATAKPIRVVPMDYESSQRGSHFKDGQFSPAAIETHSAHGREAAKAALERMQAED
ncbi:DUF3734 domain-containing protein [Paraburkholderia strydomiana]|uniref:DUF3734 domain-containing protein n=1 Tax=Paraburkholderia strydomiana TaxID=1245417 RepID=UPI001BE5F7EC|nr:DUF3734 domain-containing protein [Paraburkholderia strydomiana]MBT2792949.1 DUF3734 domain-containing protein [Paraburkholderia strydomiana]